MIKTAEQSLIDMRFERYRLKDRVREKQLLCSIIEHGIREPLQCIEKPGGQLILLDGFKRLRCSKHLKINIVPVISIGSDEAVAIIQFMRLSSNRGLNILEEAMLIDELSSSYGLGVREIARRLEHSPAWVSIRLGIIGEMSQTVKTAVFSGRFPVRSYMYTIRMFTRVNSIKKADIDAFVKAVSGKGLSIRAIELLAQGYFNGSAKLKEQILGGNINWTLSHLMHKETGAHNDIESRMIEDLKLVQGCISRIAYKRHNPDFKSTAFFVSAQALAGEILKRLKPFEESLKEFYDNTTG